MKKRQVRVLLRALLICVVFISSLSVSHRTGYGLQPLTTTTEGWVQHWDIDSLPGGAIEYWINPTFPPGIKPFATQEQLVQTIQRAFQIWEDVPTSSVKFRFMGLTSALSAQDGKNVVTFLPQPPLPEQASGVANVSYVEQAGSFTLPNGRMIQASSPGQIYDADIQVNTRVSFTIKDEHPLPSGVEDLLGLLVHEIGHLLGLCHGGTGQTPMHGFATWGGGIFCRELSTDDIFGVSMLYPEEGFLQRQGRILGRVRHRGGAPVFGAHVVAIEAQTGRVVSSTRSGLTGVRSDRVPERFSRTSGDFLLMVPPGEYLILAEPFGGEGKGTPLLSGIFGESGGELFVDTNFAPALSAQRIRVAAGGQVEGTEIIVGPRSTLTPVLGRTASLLLREDLGKFVDPARARPTTSPLLLAFEKGLNLIEGTRLLPGVRARFLAQEIKVTSIMYLK